MSRLSTFLSGLIVGGVAVLVSMNFYVVRATDGFHLVPKVSAKLEQPYVDIRTFKVNDWQSRQSLAIAIVRANKGELLGDSALSSFKQTTQELLNRLSGSNPSRLTQ